MHKLVFGSPSRRDQHVVYAMLALLRIFLYGSVIPVAIAFGLLRAFASNPTSLRDFGSFFASGKAVAEGLNPYGIYPLTYAVSTTNFCGYNQNLNPPTMLPLFELLSQLSPSTAFLVWQITSIAAGAALLAILLRTHRDQIDIRAILWFPALGAIWDTLYLGQVYLPLALLSAIAWLFLREKRDIGAGLLIGLLAALKPNFLVWPLLLLIAGHRRSAAAAGIVTLAVVLSSLALYGPTVYVQWLELVRSDAARAAFPTNGSLIGLFSRIDATVVGQVTAVALLIAAAIWAWIKQPPVLVASGVALVVSLLASPVAWADYSLFLLPILFSHWKSRGLIASASMGLLAVPQFFTAKAVFESWWLAATVGSLYTWVFIACAYLALRTNAAGVSMQLSPLQCEESNVFQLRLSPDRGLFARVAATVRPNRSQTS